MIVKKETEAVTHKVEDPTGTLFFDNELEAAGWYLVQHRKFGMRKTLLRVKKDGAWVKFPGHTY